MTSTSQANHGETQTQNPNPLADEEHRKVYADLIHQAESQMTEREVRKLCQVLTIALRNPNHIGPLRRFLGVEHPEGRPAVRLAQGEGSVMVASVGDLKDAIESLNDFVPVVWAESETEDMFTLSLNLVTMEDVQFVFCMPVGHTLTPPSRSQQNA